MCTTDRLEELEKREKTAHHEAGHAVVNHLLGWYPGSVTIVPDAEKGILGFHVGEDLWADGSKDADYIVRLYAGGAAQRRFNPKSGNDGCGDDDEEASEILALHPDFDEQTLRQRADALVRKHWPEIEAVAETLLAEKTVSGDDVEFICVAIEEGEDWRRKLPTYRATRKEGWA